MLLCVGEMPGLGECVFVPGSGFWECRGTWSGDRGPSALPSFGYANLGISIAYADIICFQLNLLCQRGEHSSEMYVP